MAAPSIPSFDEFKAQQPPAAGAIPSLAEFKQQAEATSGAPKSFTDHLGDFAGHTWDALTGTVTGAANTVMHPIDTASQILRDAADEIGKGKQAYEKGDYDRAAEHFKYALPVAGPLLRQMRQETDAGDYGAALGDITGTVLGGKLLARVPEVPGAVKSAAPVVTAAAKAGGADVAIGAVKTAAGAALAKAGPLGEIGDVIAGVPIVKSGLQQMGRGARAAFQAGREAYNALGSESAPASAPARTPIWTGPDGRPSTPPDFTPIPGKLPSGRVPGGPAIDTATGEIVQPAGDGEFAAPPPAESVTPAPALARAAAPTTSQPKTILNDVDAYLASKQPPPGEPGEAAAPAATPPPPAAPAAPAAAEPPPYGKQYITPAQVTRYAADNGLAEDDAAAALHKQGVSVVNRASTNRVLHAIGAELGYDHGTLSEIAHATYGTGLGKITHEQMMEMAETLGNEQATKEPLATKRVGSPADAAIAPEAEGSPLGGVVAQLPTGDIHADPVRFQYKAGMGQGGAGDELRGVTKFDPEKSGILSVWKDPADGKTYVVNGHHRLELAQRTGAENLTVRYIDAANAAEARAKGAMINIAEGRGTSIDAAKVFRDSGATAADLQNQGLSLTGSVAKEGQALANLEPNLFNQVVSGEMKPARGAMIGQVADHADQRQLVQLIKEREASGKPMTDGQVGELLRMQAPQVTETQHSLFGDDEISRSLIAEKAGVSDYVQSRLTQKRRTFNAVGTERAATRLAEAGNVIDAEKNAAIAEATNQEHAVYQKLSTSTGPVADALDEAAKALHAGENPAIVKVRTYAKIEPILKREADKLTGRGGAPSERSEGSAQPGSAEAGRGKHDRATATTEEDLEAPLKESIKAAREKNAKVSDLMR